MNRKLILIRPVIISLFLIILFSSCSFLKFQSSAINIIENDWSGKEVMFADVSDEILKKTNINRSWSPMKRKRTKSYYKFQKVKATVVGDYTTDGSRYLVIELKRRKQYKRKRTPWEIKNNSLPNHIYLFSDFEAAKAMVGTDIWLNDVNDVRSFFSYAQKAFNRFAKVKVIDVFPYQNGGKDWPLWLIVKSIDDLPAIWVACALARGQSYFKEIFELTLKESNRIKTMSENLNRFGIKTHPTKDSLKIYGNPKIKVNKLIKIPATLDHRCCLCMHVFANVTGSKVLIKGFNTVASSFPNWLKLQQQKFGTKYEIKKN